MNIRRALPADARALAVLEQTQPRASGWKETGFAGELAQPCSAVWAAWENTQAVGFVALRFAADFCEILNVAVHPDYTRRSIGHKLLSYALEQIKAQGVCRVTLEVAADNIPARGLYAKIGFEPLGVRKRFYANGQDALILGKNL